MALIPYPNVPAYAGVPAIPRTAPGMPAITVTLASVSAAGGLQANSSWGIFDSSGNPLYAPSSQGTLSTFSMAFMRSTNINDFPIEAGNAGEGAAFASFNKVWQPANPIVTLAISGPNADLGNFLTALDAACLSTNLYTVNTPEKQYVGYSIEGYSYQRTAQRGATMLLVEISLKEILQVSPSYASSPINSPQSPGATSPESGGLVAPAAPSQSALSKLFSGAGSMLGVGGAE